MTAIRVLLEETIDYAGLFPPATLEMAPTVANFDAYRGGARAWMLARLVVPVARLGEFEDAAANLLPTTSAGGETDDCWRISGLTHPAGSDEFAQDLDAIAAFNDRHAAEGSGSVLIDAIECRAPSAAAIDDALDRVPDEIVPYFELDHATDVRGMVAAMASLDAGAKIRSGGVTPDAHPSPAEFARFIAACAAARVPFKATAGLHHPLRHHAESVGCEQFGFLNVFLAGVFASEGLTDLDALESLLVEQSIDAFEITEDTIVWRGERLDVEAIVRGRTAAIHSFGSCSFEEPNEDLDALGLLPRGEALRA